MTPKNFILDVDGVLTTGHFLYSSKGKLYKIFGKDDADGLSLIQKKLKIQFISGDKRGFEISKKRIKDMKYDLELVSTINRIEWIKSKYDLSKTIYMGDGIFDHYVFKEVMYSISPNNGHKFAKDNANFITSASGGNGAIAEACLHILEKFFEPFDPNKKLNSYIKKTVNWNL